MTPERWRQVKEALAGALELHGAALTRRLEQLGAADPALRLEVEELLAAEGAGTFTAAVAAEVAEVGQEAAGEAGQRLGPYLLEREVGRGGMGTVYLARRVDGQYEARVAVKVAHPHMDTAEAAARFRQERQYLAALEHPYIARLLDGGATADGRLYLVMEFLDGLPIDRHCREHRLGLEERLALFRKVCAAVGHAHQHLIVHRDLKPSNVLVAADGEPKLVDFGIAKLLGEQVGTTVEAGRFLTPGYASPEHRAGGVVTTVSDVYSLGVLLHEVLAGCLPQPATAGDRSGDTVLASVAAAARLREDDEAGDPIEPRQLRGDLDRILAKALRLAPEERYRSAAELDEDLRRFLAREPVLARQPTLRYRAGRWMRRNRALAAALGVALALASTGLAATLWEGHRATVAGRAAERAELRARRRFDELRRLAHAVIYDYGGAIERLSGSVEVRERLVRDALTYLDSLAADAADDVGLQVELAEAYVKIGEVQGNMWVSNLGRGDDADRSYRKAAALYQSLDQAKLQDVEQRLRMAAAWAGPIAYAAWARNDVAGAVAAVARGVEQLEVLARQLPGDARVQAIEVEVERELADADASALADSVGARRHAERACALDRAVEKAADPAVEAQVSAAYCDDMLAAYLAPLGAHREALGRRRAAVARLELLVRAHPEDVYRRVDLAVFQARLAGELADDELLAEASGAARQGAERMDAVYQLNQSNGAARYRASQVLRLQADVALHRGLLEEAAHANLRAVRLARDLDGGSRSVVTYASTAAAAELQRGEILERQGDVAGARRAYQASSAALDRLLSAPEHLEGRWLQARAQAHVAALSGPGGVPLVTAAVAAMEAIAAHDPASVARRRELARWFTRLAGLTGEAPPPAAGPCTQRPWRARAGAVLRSIEASGLWLGDDDGLVPRGPCREAGRITAP